MARSPAALPSTHPTDNRDLSRRDARRERRCRAPTGESDEFTGDDIEFTVDIDRQFTDDHPARLTITLGNAGDAWLEFSYGPVLFSRFRSQPGGLFLVPDDRSHIATMTAGGRDGTAAFVPNEPIDGCWRQPDVGWMMHPIALVAKLGPGDVIREGYTVLDTGEDECLRPDAYRFEQSFEMRHRTNEQVASDVAGDDATVMLSFVLDRGESGEITASTDDPAIQ